MRSSITAATALLAAMVSAHGNIVSPVARQPGAAMAAACGQDNVKAVMADPGLPLEDLLNTPAACELVLCNASSLDHLADNYLAQANWISAEVPNLKTTRPMSRLSSQARSST